MRSLVLAALALVLSTAPAPAAERRTYDLRSADVFSVAGSGVGCDIATDVLICALRDPRTHEVLARSRLAVIGDDGIEIRLARTEVPLVGHHLLFRDAQPPPIGFPFSALAVKRRSVVVRSGDSLAIAGTHIWCTDVRTSLTCADVAVPLRVGRPGDYAVALSPTAVAVEQARGADFTPLIVWPLIGGH
jgi:hypothetical protein